MCIDKAIIQNTKKKLIEIFGEEIDDIRLEGIDISSKKKQILTFSYLIPNNTSELPSVSGSLAPAYKRLYKVITLDKQNNSILKIDDRL